MRFKVFTVVKFQIVIFWILTPWNFRNLGTWRWRQQVPSKHC